MKILKEIDSARVLLYTTIDNRHTYTRNCRHFRDGELMGAVAGLAICRYEDDGSYYLFYCDEGWNTLTDTCHSTLEEAQEQAEFEYKGVTATWEKSN